jgi:hypothetical protein
MLIPFRLYQHVEDLAFSVDSPPQLDHAAINLEIAASRCQIVWGFGLRLRKFAAIIGPKWFTQRRMVS